MTAGDRQLPRGTLYVALGQAAFLLTGYLLHALLARWLTPALYGTFNVAMTVLVWVEIAVNNGVPTALQKLLPDESLSAAAVRRAAARSQGLVSLVVFATLFLAAPGLALVLRDPALTGYLRLALLDVLAMGAYAYYRGVLNGWRVYRQLSLTVVAYSLTKLAAISLLVYLGLGVEGALVGNVISSLGGLAAGYFWTRRRPQPPVAQLQARAVDERQILAFVLPTALFTLASNVLLGLDLMEVQTLLPAMSPTGNDQVGYYSAALKLAEAPRLVLLAFNFTLLPSLSHAIAARDPARTRHYLQQTIRLLALVLLPIVALVAATAEGAMTLVFPPNYVAAAPILAILVASYAAYTVYITLVTTLLAENRPGRALLIPLALLPLAGAAIWGGLLRLGVVGAALASALSVVTAAGIVTAYVVHRYRPVVGARFLVRVALAAAVVGLLARLWSPAGLVLLLAYGLLAGLYVVLLLLLGEARAADLVQVLAWFSPKEGRKT